MNVYCVTGCCRHIAASARTMRSMARTSRPRAAPGSVSVCSMTRYVVWPTRKLSTVNAAEISVGLSIMMS